MGKRTIASWCFPSPSAALLWALGRVLNSGDIGLEIDFADVSFREVLVGPLARKGVKGVVGVPFPKGVGASAKMGRWGDLAGCLIGVAVERDCWFWADYLSGSRTPPRILWTVR